MKQLVFPKDPVPHCYREDVEMLQNSLRAEGYSASDEDVYLAWEEISSQTCSVWLNVPLRYEDDLVAMLLEHLEEVE